MSWNLQYDQLKSSEPAAAKEFVTSLTNVPQPIKDYVFGGIDGLVGLYGKDVRVFVTGYGHLCSGKDYDVTSATIEVKKAAAA